MQEVPRAGSLVFIVIFQGNFLGPKFVYILQKYVNDSTADVFFSVTINKSIERVFEKRISDEKTIFALNLV